MAIEDGDEIKLLPFAEFNSVKPFHKMSSKFLVWTDGSMAVENSSDTFGLHHIETWLEPTSFVGTLGDLT